MRPDETDIRLRMDTMPILCPMDWRPMEWRPAHAGQPPYYVCDDCGAMVFAPQVMQALFPMGAVNQLVTDHTNPASWPLPEDDDD